MKLKAFIFSIMVFFTLFASPAMSEDGKQYLVGPGDVLEVSVWKDESLSREIVIPPDGVISFPLIGDIDTQGMSVADIEDVVMKKIKEYVPDAFVTMMLLEIKSLNVYVIGKVNKPGVYSIFLDTNVMQALSMAGGLNPFASEKKIQILRRRNGVPSKIPFNYKEVIEGENLEQNIVLQRGDVIVVP